MTNEQLHVLLLNITEQLERAFVTATEALKDTDAPFETTEEFIGANIFSLAASARNPKDYRTVDTTPTALNEIKMITDTLRDHANALINTGK